MTKLVARLILAMLILPVSGAVLLFLSFAVFEGTGAPSALSVSIVWIVEYLVIASYWILLWRGTVRWTKQRLIGTFLATLAALLCGAVGVVVLLEFVNQELSAAMMIGCGLVPIAWVFGTVLVWMESSGERLERLKSYGTDTVCCPTCGYNMTGLLEARCPECGARFTVDELLTAQHEREQELQQS